MSKKQQGAQRPAEEPAVAPPERAAALGILMQRQNLLQIHAHLGEMRAQMGVAQYLSWLAEHYPGMADPIGLSANEFLHALCQSSPELAELITNPAALAELERIAFGVS